jgi:hypothetical protein
MSPWTGPAAALAQRVHDFIVAADEGRPTEPFEVLAADLHAHQRAVDPVIAALSPQPTRALHEIPGVPVGLFKDVPIGAVRDEEAAVTFRTSGTAVGRRGVVRLRSSALYDLGAHRWHQRCVPNAPTDVLALLQDPASVADSSLAHMVRGFGRVSWHLGPSGLDHDGVARRLREAEGPLYLAATGFALAELLRGPLPALPPSSVLMVTGGFKGREVDVDEAGLLRLARAQLMPGRLVTEYGMTELSSQLWGSDGEPYRAPPWLRVLPLDPATGAVLPPGSRGQLRFVDLCNLDSAVVIDTLDEGTVATDGSVTLHGRLAGAEVRGCSLTVEDLLDAHAGRR